MKSYSDYAIKAKRSRFDLVTKWATKEGVFETPQGKWIARVLCSKRGYVTLSMHDKKEIAEKVRADFYEQEKQWHNTQKAEQKQMKQTA